MRVNYTLWSGRLNGGVRVIFELANGLADRGHDVTVTMLGRPEDAAWFPLRARPIFAPRAATRRQTLSAIAETAMTRPRSKHLRAVGKQLGLGRLSRAVSRRIRDPIDPRIQIDRDAAQLQAAIPDCDVNIATYNLTAAPVVRSRKGKPVYHMQHHEPLMSSEPHLQAIARDSYSLPLRKIANSTWLKSQITGTYGDTDVIVVNPAVDHTVFFPRRVARRSPGLRVITLGRYERWKGLREMARAMEIVTAIHPQVEWVIFGTHPPPYELPVRYEFVNSPTGDRLAELYSSCDIAVSPSWYESFPLPPIEAMACGLPVVCTPYGTEDFAFHGDTALVVPPRDPLALAGAILRLVEDPDFMRTLADRGRAKSLAFTWQASVDRVEQVLSEVARA